jgi:hypothetical protein
VAVRHSHKTNHAAPNSFFTSGQSDGIEVCDFPKPRKPVSCPAVLTCSDHFEMQFGKTFASD